MEEATNPRESILRRAEEADLVVMGLQRNPLTQAAIGPLALAIASESSTPLILVGGRRGRARRR